METVTCPQCGRTVKVSRNKFGDSIYARHKMATAWDKQGRVSQETHEDLRPPYNVESAYTYEIDCPNSGQPL